MSYTSSEASTKPASEDHNYKMELSLDNSKKDDEEKAKNIKIIQSEDELLEIDALNDKIDTYIMEAKDGTMMQAICTECGYNGLTLANLYVEHDIAVLPCPTVMWPTGSSFLVHYKVYRATICTFCGYQGYSSYDFSYDKVEHECHEPGGGNYWIIPDKTHNDGIDNHQCPCSECTDVYRRLPDIVKLR